MVKLNFGDFSIITLKPYVTNFNHGYVMAWDSFDVVMVNINLPIP